MSIHKRSVRRSDYHSTPSFLLFRVIVYNMEQIPVIDFGKFDSDPVAVAAAVRDACESIGFFFLKNVGIPQAEVDGMFELVRISEPTGY